MQDVVALVGIVCMIACPILVVLYWITFFQLGRVLSVADRAAWKRIKAKVPATLGESREQTRLLKQFISDREYVALGNPRVSLLAKRFHVLQRAIWVSMIGAIGIGVWAVWGPR